MPDPTNNLLPISQLDPAATNSSNQFENEKNFLSNQLIKGEVERNAQRKSHRTWLFVFGLSACVTFYGLFCYLAWRLYSEPDNLPEIPVAWVIPLIGMLALPTIFLVVFVLCVYREKPKISADAIAQSISKIMQNGQS